MANEPRTNDDFVVSAKKGIDDAVAFSHVQLYVDHVEDLQVYKDLEDRLNQFAAAASQDSDSLAQKKLLWRRVIASSSGTTSPPPDPFCPQNRDVVKQLLSGFGFRVTGARYGSLTRSVLVTSRDPKGVQILVTCVCSGSDRGDHDATGVETGDDASSGIFAAGELSMHCFEPETMACRQTFFFDM